MQIHFERTGGFAGMRLTKTIDTASLPAETANQLQQMVNEANFFDLPAVMTASTPGADQFQYKVTIEAEERTHTIEVGDETAPDELQPLLRQLTALTRSRR